MKGISFFIFLMACSSIQKTGDPVQDALAKRQRQLTQCYLESDSYKGPHVQPEGIVTTAFTIDENGTVIGERIVGTSFKDANLHACVLHVINTTPFEKPKDGAIEVVQPIGFHQ